MRRLAALALLGGLVATPVLAQDESAKVDESELICLAVAHIWNGTEEDIARIEQQPVPDSFRRPFEGGGCPRFSLVEESLLQWHFRFGDEATASQALAYLENASLPQPASGRALAAAIADLRPALEQMQQAIDGGDVRSALAVRNETDWSDMQAALAPFGAHRFLADQYLTAARFYSSAAFVRRAAPHMAALDEFRDILEGEADTAAAQRMVGLDFAPDHEVGQAVLFERYGTLRAALLGERDALPKFPNLASREVTSVIESAIWDGIPFDHLERLAEDNDALEEALDDDSDLPKRMAVQWAEQAFADLARMQVDPDYRDSCDTDTFDQALIGLFLSSMDGHDYASGRGYRGVDWPLNEGDMRVALLLAKADCASTVAARLAPDGDRQDLRRAFWEGLTALDAAHDIVPADRSPGRFRHIATRYLDLARHCLALSDPEKQSGDACEYARDPRTIRYFETTLAALPAIRGVRLESDTP